MLSMFRFMDSGFIQQYEEYRKNILHKLLDYYMCSMSYTAMQSKTTKKTVEADLEHVTASRHINDSTRYLLWGRAAGRCQFKGCNKSLWKNSVTQEKVLLAEAAHIYAFSSDGPRGNAGIEAEYLNTYDNLLLVCQACHTTIDKTVKEGGRYDVKLLRKWKRDHGQRIERVTGIDPSRSSHAVLFGGQIGKDLCPLAFDEAGSAMFHEERFPAEDRAIELGVGPSEFTEVDPEVWAREDAELQRKFGRLLQERLNSGEVKHLSVFGLARMPFLIRLGTLLGDKRDVDVYQLHRIPKGWQWPSKERTIDLRIERPADRTGSPALVVALSGSVSDERIQKVLGPDVSIWRLTLPSPTPECIRSKADLNEVYRAYLNLMDEIKSAHGQGATLSIFPAAPVSAMIELGRTRFPKAELDWIIYDQVNELQGFVKTIRIGSANAPGAAQGAIPESQQHKEGAEQ